MTRTTSLAAALVAGAVSINAGFAAVGSGSIGSTRVPGRVAARTAPTLTPTLTPTPP